MLATFGGMYARRGLQFDRTDKVPNGSILKIESVSAIGCATTGATSSNYLLRMLVDHLISCHFPSPRS